MSGKTSAGTDLVLSKINSARDFLVKAVSLQEVNKVIAMAQAASVYAKRIKASQETSNAAAEIRLRAERRLGELIAKSPKNDGGRPKKTGSQTEPVSKPPTLAEVGIDKKLSSRAQMLAAVDEQEFEEKIGVGPERELNPSKIAEDFRRKGKEDRREERREENRKIIQQSPEPTTAIVGGAKFATIAIDPPWDWGDEGDVDQMGRARPTYGTMPFEKIKELPVADLADDDCHLYLWITNRSLPKGFELIDAWGFRYVTCLTWCKPSIGMGNYFRGSTEQILFAVKGSQPLKRKDVGTWFHAKRGPAGHSSKPIEFYDIAESCSPGPFLEMFARSGRSGWTSWGAEVAADVA